MQTVDTPLGQLGRIVGVVVVAIVFAVILGAAFGRHFIPDLKTLLRAEFRTKAGWFSFLGFLVLVYLAIDREALEYVVLLLSPRPERNAVMQQIAHSQTLITFTSSGVFMANLALLAILGIGGTRKRSSGSRKKRR